MRISIFLLSKFLPVLFLFGAVKVQAQDYTTEDFVGTWHGNISATTFGGYDDPITLTIYEDGFYTETSGHLMPTIYPNTQMFEYDAATNRLHFWYLDLVYAGQYFYQHFYFEVVYFENDTLEAHYNFWDDPQPFPDAGVIYIVKENNNATPPPVNLELMQMDEMIYVEWEAPENGNPESYNVYVSVEMGEHELLGSVQETMFLVSESAAAGLNEYYITAVYESGESDPSESLIVTYATPEPSNLSGEPQTGEIMLEWTAPAFDEVLPAAFLGYNVYHKFEEGTYTLVEFTEDLNFIHENPETGLHSYFVTAVYNGGESIPSNETEVSYVISSLDQNLLASVKVYPNPANDFVSVDASERIREISIINQQGQLVQKLGNGLQQTLIDVSELPTGLYTLLLDTENGVIIRKLIKK